MENAVDVTHARWWSRVGGACTAVHGAACSSKKCVFVDTFILYMQIHYIAVGVVGVYSRFVYTIDFSFTAYIYNNTQPAGKHATQNGSNASNGVFLYLKNTYNIEI